MSTRRTFLTGALALSATALAGTEPATAAARRAALTTQDWMAGLADATPVQRLTIPGAHDSGARYGGPWTECQNTTVAEQLSAGVLRGERSGGPPDLRRLRRHHGSTVAVPSQLRAARAGGGLRQGCASR